MFINQRMSLLRVGNGHVYVKKPLPFFTSLWYSLVFVLWGRRVCNRKGRKWWGEA